MPFQKQLFIQTAILALSLPVSAQPLLKDGTCQAEVIGHNAPMTVKVQVSGGRVSMIDTSKNLETDNVGRKALQILSDRILATQSVGVDSVSGATFSSMALKKAVLDCVKQAGGDESRWKKSPEYTPTEPLEFKSSVIVVGGGGAGLAAAVSALQNGARDVLIIEKLGYLGGSTNVSGGAFNAADPVRQKKQGIEDSIEKHYQQTLKGGHDKGNPELVRYLTENALPTIQWLESMGMRFKEKIGTATGALWQRSHYPVAVAGTGYVNTLENALKQYPGQVQILTDTKAVSLITQNGRVTGVKAFKKKQPVTAYGKSVIIATGGFGANIGFRQKVNTGVWKEVNLDSRIGSSNIAPVAQGDGLVLAEKAGAELIGLSDIQLHPNGTPGTGLFQDIATSGRNRLFINTKGDRFVNEGAARDTLCKAIFAQGGEYWLLMNHLRYPDKAAIDKYGISMNDMLKLGRVKEATTLEEAAKLMGVEYSRLSEAVEEYNRAARHEVKKDKFGFVANNTEDKPLTEGPWYLCKKVPSVHHTMGGIRINTRAQVLKSDGTPLEGLFAAGEVTGGIHGSNRLGGNAVADIMTFGRAAGRNAARYAEGKF